MMKSKDKMAFERLVGDGERGSNLGEWSVRACGLLTTYVTIPYRTKDWAASRYLSHTKPNEGMFLLSAVPSTYFKARKGPQIILQVS